MKKWQNIWLVLIYRMVRMGITDTDIAKQLGIRRERLSVWKKTRADVREVYEIAEKERGEGENMPEWVFQRLSPELKVVWRKIEGFWLQKDGAAKVELMLEDEGKRTRQQLFLYALCVCNFSPSRALRKVNVSKRELERWLEQDYQFRELCDEVQWHKGNFFEESLVKLVRDGNVAATLFANKTYNKERGYMPSSQQDVHHSGSIVHGVVDLAEIMDRISPGAKMELLAAIRDKDREEAKKLTVTERISGEIAREGQKAEIVLRDQ